MNKKILSLIAVLVLLATMVAAATASANGYYAVYSHCKNGKPLNVREGPGKDYYVIDRIPYGKAIYVVGETYPGWLQLNDGGFVQASLTCKNYPGPYVPEDPGTSTGNKDTLSKVFDTAKFVTPYMITLKATAKSKGLAPVRWVPSKTGKAMQEFTAGTQVRVLAELDKWYQVQDPISEIVGFVNVAYVEK